MVNYNGRIEEIERLSHKKQHQLFFSKHSLFASKNYRFLATQCHASCAQKEIRAQLDTLSSLYPPSLSYRREGCC